jgi:hypothetical protein
LRVTVTVVANLNARVTLSPRLNIMMPVTPAEVQCDRDDLDHKAWWPTVAGRDSELSHST